jgi:prepilin-type N-terminal cleavage/methylation domain-containing protein
MGFSNSHRHRDFDRKCLALPPSSPMEARRSGASSPRRVDAATRRQPLIPHPQSLMPRPRRGFTLIEMLIVIGIMLMLVTAAATMLPSSTESRRTREAARMINVYGSTARNRAMELGRPCCITLHCLNSVLLCALDADQRERPPKYGGETDQSMARVQINPGWSGSVALACGTNPEVMPPSMVRPGDLIQFNCQGEIFSIVNVNNSGGTIDANGFFSGVSSFTIAAFSPMPHPDLPPSFPQPVPFCIYRSPVKSGATPLQLPSGAVVDLQWSGVGGTCIGATLPWNSSAAYGRGQLATHNGATYVCTNTSTGNAPASSPNYWQPLTDVSIQLSSTGAVDSMFGMCYNNIPVPVTDTIYLLVGKRERVGTFNTNPTPPLQTKTDQQLSNVEDLNNFWVTINAQTGLINTEPVAAGATTAAYNAYQAATGSVDQKWAAATIAACATARTLAVQSQGMGGK